VSEGIELLTQLCTIKVKVKGKGEILKVPTPQGKMKKLLEAASIKLPPVLPTRKHKVVTRKKLSK